MTDLVLVNPNNRVPSPMAAIETPLWLGLIAGDAVAKGKTVAIVDAEAENLTVNQTVLRVMDHNPEQIMLVVMGGNPSVSSTPKWPVTKELLEYMDADVTGIHPLAMKHPRAIQYDFKTLPAIPWHLFPMDKYKAHNWHCLANPDYRSPYGVLYTSLNCPFNCYYCNVHTLYGDRQVRYRPIEDIEADLVYFNSKGIRNIKIWDELFCLNEKRVTQICEFIYRNGYDFNIWAYARADTITAKMLATMKRAGVNWLAYGFESGSSEVRAMSNKNLPETNIENAINLTRGAGINIMGNFIFGLPSDTPTTVKQTYEMACRENFEYVNFYVAMPYPGSQWYADLKRKPSDWNALNQYSHKPAVSDWVVGFRDWAFNSYFERTEYRDMVLNRFGSKGLDSIENMLKWKIRE